MSTKPSPKALIHLGEEDGGIVKASGAVPIDCSQGNTFTALLTGNCIFPISSLYPGEALSLLLLQDAFGGHSATFAGQSIELATGASVAPQTGANAGTVYLFLGVDANTIRLMSALPVTGGGGGGGQAVVYSDLPDSDITVNPKIGANGFVARVITAIHVVTVDAAGAANGDLCVIQRIDESRFPLFLDYAPGETLRIYAGSLIWLQHNGTQFQPVYSTARVGDQVRLVTDFFNDDGTRVCGDGRQDNATGIQRAIDSVRSDSTCARLHFPEGIYCSSAQIRLLGGSVAFGNSACIRMTGDLGATRGRTGVVLQYIGADLDDEAFVKCVGLTGSQVEQFDIDCNGRTAIGFWTSIENLPLGDESSQNNDFRNLSVFNVKDVVGATCFAIGPKPGSITSGASDVADQYFYRCIGNATQLGGAAPVNTDAWTWFQSNNTKDHRLSNCTSTNSAHGLFADPLGGTLLVDYHRFQSNQIDVQKSSGHLVLLAPKTEGSQLAFFEDGEFGPSSTIIDSWTWDGTPVAGPNTVAILHALGQLTMRNSMFNNNRGHGTIQSFDTGTGVITITGNPSVLDADEPICILNTGAGVIPAAYEEGQEYFIAASPAPTNSAFALAKTSGGAAIIPATAGVPGGALFTVQRVGIQIASPEAGSDNTLEIHNSQFWGHFGNLDVRGNSLTDPQLLIPNGVGTLGPAPNVVCTNIYGGMIGFWRKLREIDGFPKDYRSLAIDLTQSDLGWQLLGMGSPDRPDIFQANFAHLIRERGTLQDAFTYLNIPFGQGVEWAYLDVTEAFAGTGITSVVAKLGIYPIPPPADGNMLGDTAGLDCTVAGLLGRVVGDFGPAFTSGQVLGAYYPPAGQLTLITLHADANFSNLTAGSCTMYVKRRFQ